MINFDESTYDEEASELETELYFHRTYVQTSEKHTRAGTTIF